jgi:hypothetical protein
MQVANDTVIRGLDQTVRLFDERRSQTETGHNQSGLAEPIGV